MLTTRWDGEHVPAEKPWRKHARLEKEAEALQHQKRHDFQEARAPLEYPDLEAEHLTYAYQEEVKSLKKAYQKNRQR